MSIVQVDERENVNELPSHTSAPNELPREQLQRSGRYLPPPPQMSPPPPMRHTLPPVAPRQRAAIACLNCRKRKVRCCGRDSSDSQGRCTTCARTSRPCIFVAVRNEAFATPYGLDSAPRRDSARSLRSPSWQRRESYPYPHLRQQGVRDDKLWVPRQSGPADWRGTEELFRRPDHHESFRSAPPPAHLGERSKLLMDRTSYNPELPFAHLHRASPVYQSSMQDPYLHSPWVGVHTFHGYGQHGQLPSAPMPATFLPSMPSIVPPGPYPGPFNSSWQQVKLESPIKSA